MMNAKANKTNNYISGAESIAEKYNTASQTDLQDETSVPVTRASQADHRELR